jgi:hypothetical protein
MSIARGDVVTNDGDSVYRKEGPIGVRRYADRPSEELAWM